VENKWVKPLFYTIAHSLMMGQQDQTHVGICVLQHYCNSKEVSVFVGHNVTTES